MMKTGKGKIVMGHMANQAPNNPSLRIVVMGQPRSGKTTVATALSQELELPVIHTDRLRADMRLHCPWCGYDTEIEPWKEQEFIAKLDVLATELGQCIIEGSSIAPRTLSQLSPDAAVLMWRDIPPTELLAACRKHDDENIWTYKKADTYLLRLFSDYRVFAQQWTSETSVPLAETHPDFDAGISAAIANLKEQLRTAGKL